jgi:valyl-tRNA synthetase
MSKSLGNSPDPLDLIEKYSADGVRVGMLLCSPAGNDIMFDESSCEQGRNFANKIWNAFRLVKGWSLIPSLSEGGGVSKNATAIAWFESRFNEALEEIEHNFSQYRLSEALMVTYKLVWDDFCAWYLEMVKPAYQQPIDKASYEATIRIFENILKVIHPFMPFISEELWHDELFGERAEKDCCIVAQLPSLSKKDEKLLAGVEMVKQIISEIRNVRNSKQISPKEALTLSIRVNSDIDFKAYQNIIFKLANITELSFVNDKLIGAAAFMAGRDEFFIPLAGNIDAEAEKERIEKEIAYLNGFLTSVNAKLSNERFVQNAKPGIVANEQNKKADAEAKIAIFMESLKLI